MRFDSVELASATKDYNRKNLLGRGGFGSVYKGSLKGGLDVAIKVLTQVSVCTWSMRFARIRFSRKDSKL